MKYFVKCIFSWVLYHYAIKGCGVIIGKSKISKNNVFIYGNVFIKNSVIKNFVKIYNLVKLNGVTLEGYNRIGSNCKITSCNIGTFSYIADNSFLNNCEVGKYCSIGMNTIVGLGCHPVNFMSSSPIFYSKDNVLNYEITAKIFFEEHKKSMIGNDVWIGASVFIADGVTIGDGAIIGAGAVVVNNIPPYAVAVGVPCKVLKYRYSAEIIDKIRQLDWWNKDICWIKKNIHLFQKPLINISDLDSIKNT